MSPEKREDLDQMLTKKQATGGMSPDDFRKMAQLIRKILERHDAKRLKFQKKAPAYTAGVFADKVGKEIAPGARMVPRWASRRDQTRRFAIRTAR